MPCLQHGQGLGGWDGGTGSSAVPAVGSGQRELLGAARVLWCWAGDLKVGRFPTWIFMGLIL